MTRNELIIKLAYAINSCSAENGSDTPDFILAQLLADVLGAFDAAVRMRETWYGRALRPQLMGTLVCDSGGTTHAAAEQPGAAPSQEGAGSATAAPGGEPKEPVCRWTAKPGWSAPACQATQQVEWRESTAAAFKFCPHCGGKIITEAT